jgi:hypothetical protein
MALEKSITILNTIGVATDADGVWNYVGNVRAPFTVHVTGSGAGDTITINASCAAKPLNTTHDVSVGAIVADGFTVISQPVKWIKARKPAATQSSAVFLHGHLI